MNQRNNKFIPFLLAFFLATALSIFNVRAQGHINYGCDACHISHNSPGGSLTALAGNANLCISCHNTGGTANSLPFDNADKAIPGVSGTSHSWDVPATNSTYETVSPTDAEMAARLDGGNIICSVCHDQHNSNTNPSYLRLGNAGDAMCKDCHSPRNVGRYADDNTNNKGSHPVGLSYPTGDTKYNDPPTGSVTIPGGNIECSSCHQTHYAATTDGNLLRQTNDDALCTECHTYSSHESMGCNTCHQTHNTNKANIYLIRNTVATPNSGDKTVIFTAQSGANSGADGDANYDGICEVCHTNTNYHMNDGTGSSHNNATNCTSCHPHKDSFAPTGCSDCHIANFPDWGTADSHFAHTDKYSFACNTCHDGYGMGGSLEPNHPSGGTANTAFDPNGLARRNGNDSNTPVLNGDKTCDNIYCHSNGRSAYRGTDGTYTWSGTTGSQSATYATAPAWTSPVGTINTCNSCHSGTGNMSDPYTITTPGLSDPSPPPTGEHRRGNHRDNDRDLSGSGWTSVNCFWCHNAVNGDSGSPIYQGTYGTGFHVDGQTFFDPRSYVDGGTMVNNLSGGSSQYSYYGSSSHCGNGRKCW